MEAVLAENEILRQEKYSLQLSLETSVQTVNTQASEIDHLRVQYDTSVKQLAILQKESSTQKQQINNFKKERIDFEKNQDDCLSENQSLKKQIKCLELQIKELEQRAESSRHVEIASYEVDTESDINDYLCQNKNLNEALLELQCDLKSSKLSENQLANRVKELEEGVLDRDKELAGYSVEIQKAKDYATELQGEIELLKLEQVDVNRKGNSVFGEIDDRRKIVEKEYKLLMKRHQNLTDRYKSTREELSVCKNQLASVSRTSHSHQDSYIDKLEDQLASARREVENLTGQLRKKMREGQENRREPVLSGSGEYDYLRVMNEQAEKKVKEMENKLISVHIQNIAHTEELDRTRREMYRVQLELEEANLENRRLHHTVKELTVTIETKAPTASESAKESEIMVREFDPNKVTHTKRERKGRRKKRVSDDDDLSTIMDSMDEDVMEGKETNQTQLKSVLQDLREKINTDSVCRSAENNLKENTKISDPTGLDVTSYQENSRTFSNRDDRKQGQCAQQ